MHDEMINRERLQKLYKEISDILCEAVAEAAEALARQLWWLDESLEDMREIAAVYDKPKREKKAPLVNAKIKPLLLDKRNKLHRCRNNC